MDKTLLQKSRLCWGWFIINWPGWEKTEDLILKIICCFCKVLQVADVWKYQQLFEDVGSGCLVLSLSLTWSFGINYIHVVYALISFCLDCFQVYPMLLVLFMFDWCSWNHFVRNSASRLPPTLCSNHAKGPTSGFSVIFSNQPHGFHGFGRVPTKFSYSFAEVFIGSLPRKKVDSRQSSKACQTQVITSPSMGLGLANCCAGISRGDIPTIDLGPGRLIRLIHLRSSDLYRFVPTRHVVQKSKPWQPGEIGWRGFSICCLVVSFRELWIPSFYRSIPQNTIRITVVVDITLCIMIILIAQVFCLFRILRQFNAYSFCSHRV